jgi:enamine deaminase RidA (YjgF/YER057c/UK114 family)
MQSSQLSKFEHLVAALFLRPESRIAAMNFTMYCDASGKQSDVAMVVAGFVASTQKWQEFSEAWKEVLQDFGVRYFHMREFAHSVGEFSSWKGHEKKRQEFLAKLLDLIVRTVGFWTGAVVLKNVYDKVDADFELHESFHPYALCGFQCCVEVQKWREAHHIENEPIEYIFESGDEHSSQLFERITEQFRQAPIFRQKNEPPLQAADFAAWETLKIYRLLEVETDKLFEKTRASFQRLGEIEARLWGHFEEPRLRVMCRLMDIPRRRTA